MSQHQKGVIDFLGIQLSRLRLFHKELKAFRMKSKISKKEMYVTIGCCLCLAGPFGTMGGLRETLALGF